MKILESPYRILCVLAFVGALLYANSINSPFIYDDVYNIKDNSAVHDLKFVLDYFTDPGTHNVLPENAPYRPLMTLSNAVLWAVGNGATWPYHAYKITSHILMAWLIFLVSSLLIKNVVLPVDRRIVAFLGAVLFLVHPALSEPVNYISSTSTLQCSLFYLLAFYLALKRKHFLMSLSFLCSVLSKEEGVTFPGALLLYFLIFERGSFLSRNFFKTFAYALVPWILYLVVYLNLPQSVDFSQVTRDVYFFTQLRAWVYYLVGIFAPWGYSIEHMEFGFSETFWNAAVVLSCLVNAVFILVALFLAFFRKHREYLFLGFGFLWFYLTLLPASSVFPLAEPINEHRYYLSYALLFPALVYGFFSLHRVFPKFKSIYSAKAFAFSVLGLVLVLSSLTFAQNTIWKDPQLVWANTVKQDPTNGRAHLNLGLVFLRKGQFAEALEHINDCVKYRPAYLYCYVNLGIYHDAVNNLNDAQKAFVKAVELAPRSVVALSHLGEHLFLKEQKVEESLQYLRRCDEVSEGRNSKCLYLLSYALRELKRYPESLEVAQRLVVRAPENKESRFELGLALIFNNRLADAERLFNDELKRDANEVNALQNLAWISMQQKNWPLAKELLLKKVRLQPNHIGAWKNLRETAEQLKDVDLVKMCDEQIGRIQPK